MRVHVVVPEGFDNPGQPTGGNIYDRRVCAGLAEAGWDVRVTTVAGAWPAAGACARAGYRPRRSDGHDQYIPSGLGQSGADTPVVDVAAGRPTGIVEPLGGYYVDPHDVPGLQSACRTEPASTLRPG